MNQDDIDIKQDVELVCDDTVESKAEPLEVKPQKIAYRALLDFPLVVFGMGALFSGVCIYYVFAILPKNLNGVFEIGLGLFAVFLFLVSIGALIFSAYCAVKCWKAEKLREKILSSAEPFAAIPELKLAKWTKFELECEAGEHPVLIHGLRATNFFFGVLSALLGSSSDGRRTVTLVFDTVPITAKVDAPLEVRIDMPMAVALSLKKHPEKTVLCVVHPETKEPYAVSIDESVFFVS